MQKHRTHHLPQHRIITGLLPTGEYGAYDDDRDDGRVRGFGHTRAAAIADLLEEKTMLGLPLGSSPIR
jgi:hypothetical protein